MNLKKFNNAFKKELKAKIYSGGGGPTPLSLMNTLIFQSRSQPKIHLEGESPERTEVIVEEETIEQKKEHNIASQIKKIDVLWNNGINEEKEEPKQWKKETFITHLNKKGVRTDNREIQNYIAEKFSIPQRDFLEKMKTAKKHNEEDKRRDEVDEVEEEEEEEESEDDEIENLFKKTQEIEEEKQKAKIKLKSTPEIGKKPIKGRIKSLKGKEEEEEEEEESSLSSEPSMHASSEPSMRTRSPILKSNSPSLKSSAISSTIGKSVSFKPKNVASKKYVRGEGGADSGRYFLSKTGVGNGGAVSGEKVAASSSELRSSSRMIIPREIFSPSSTKPSQSSKAKVPPGSKPSLKGEYSKKAQNTKKKFPVSHDDDDNDWEDVDEEQEQEEKSSERKEPKFIEPEVEESFKFSDTINSENKPIIRNIIKNLNGILSNPILSLSTGSKSDIKHVNNVIIYDEIREGEERLKKMSEDSIYIPKYIPQLPSEQ